MANKESFWETWNRIRQSSDPDPSELLRIVAAFSNYFQAAERDGISFARAKGLTWAEIAEALGTSRQAAWQRASRDKELQERLRATIAERWDAVRADPDAWYHATRPFPT